MPRHLCVRGVRTIPPVRSDTGEREAAGYVIRGDLSGKDT